MLIELYGLEKFNFLYLVMKFQLKLLLIFVAVAFFFQNAVAWIVKSMVMQKYGVVIAILSVLCCVFLFFVKRKKQKIRKFFLRDSCNSIPTIMFFFMIIMSVFQNQMLQLQQLDAAVFLITIYVLSGCFIGNIRWWYRGLPLAIIIALCIPFTLEFGSGLGFFLRIASAEIVETILKHAGVAVTTSQDILILENGITQIDTPCSGLKSLFTGTLFFFAAAFVRRQTISYVFIAHYLFFCFLLFLSNVARILLIVFIADVFELRELAAQIHIPFGIFFFGVSCIVGWFLVGQNQNIESEDSAHKLPFSGTVLVSAFIMPLCFGIVLNTCCLALQPVTGWKKEKFTRLHAIPIEMTEIEQRFFAAKVESTASKWQFQYKNNSGEILSVQSAALNGMHSPEICLMGNGLKVMSVAEREFGEIHCKVIRFEKSDAAAVYWLQHEDVTTPSFLERAWLHITAGKREWTLRVVLIQKFDSTSDIDLRMITQFVQAGK
jgi:exosortase O